jgi:hypothetical protein
LLIPEITFLITHTITLLITHPKTLKLLITIPTLMKKCKAIESNKSKPIAFITTITKLLIKKSKIYTNLLKAKETAGYRNIYLLIATLFLFKKIEQ